jgi:hypothetical protein
MIDQEPTEQYRRIRARLDELLGPAFSDRAASIAITNGRNADLIRNIKRGKAKQPRGQDMVALAAFLKKPITWLTTPDAGADGEVADPTSDVAIIGRTKEARIKSGMTIETIARLLSIEPLVYERFERSIPIFPSLVARFCWVTGVSADWLFSGQEAGQDFEPPLGPMPSM